MHMRVILKTMKKRVGPESYNDCVGNALHCSCLRFHSSFQGSSCLLGLFPVFVSQNSAVALSSLPAKPCQLNHVGSPNTLSSYLLLSFQNLLVRIFSPMLFLPVFI